MRGKEMAGLVVGRLTVQELVGRRHNQLLWRCICECGNTVDVCGQVLREEKSKSCGCLLAEIRGKAQTTHGKSSSPEYRVWATMRNRCNRPNVLSYNDYGGRGIKVCPQWDNPHGFEQFMQDMGPRPVDGMIERIDNDGNYEPSNCKWVSRAIQATNKRNSVLITANGETRHLAEWARVIGCSHAAIIRRINSGMSPEEAVTKPVLEKPNAKLTIEQVRELRALPPGESWVKLGQRYGVSNTSIGNILRNKTYRE